MQQQDSLFNSSNQNLQVHRVDQTLLPAQVDSFVGCSLHCALHPPALILELERERTKEEKEREKKFYIYSDVTHTHPAGAGSTLKGKRKKKAGTRRADGQKQRRGGRGTNQPTRRNGPDQKQRTHLNPTTHYGEARGEIRDQMGD